MQQLTVATVGRDLISGLVVFLVALPLCLGVALASGAPLFSGLLAGILGGIVVGALSGSRTSVSGPAAGLTAVVASEIQSLGGLQTFLLAVVLAGVLQILLGVIKAGVLAAFVPSSVIKGLLAAIGVILVLKQVPHLLGHDTDPEGEMSFVQPDHENTLSELVSMVRDVHLGAAVIGAVSIGLLLIWDRTPLLKRSLLPAPLLVVLLGVGLASVFRGLGEQWAFDSVHFVEVPVADSFHAFLGQLTLPEFSQWTNPAVYTAALVVAAVASLETLLNLEAVDKIDPLQRRSPPNRELVAQGIGNVLAGLLGAIPMTSVIVRSSVNINSGGTTRLSTIVHGTLLLGSVALLPSYLNMIPLSCLAAILLMTGIKLASPELVRSMWREGRYQFVPFISTVVAIVFTDLLIGILIGLGISLAFILNSNLRRPLRRVLEKHLGGDVLHIELPNQVSFLNRAALDQCLRDAAPGTHVLLDAEGTDYIDPDVLGLIRNFKGKVAPLKGIQVSLRGFRERYDLGDEILYVDYSTRELQQKITPAQVLRILRDGNERFRSGQRLTRDFGRQVGATALAQHPLAVVLSCIDSRTPAELILDLGLGDVFSVRVAGNVVSPQILGSIEYGCVNAGAKLVLVLGHTRCGAVTAAVSARLADRVQAPLELSEHVRSILRDIDRSIEKLPEGLAGTNGEGGPDPETVRLIDEVAARNVERTVEAMVADSEALRRLVQAGQLAVLGGLYDVATGGIDFLPQTAVGLPLEAITQTSPRLSPTAG